MSPEELETVEEPKGETQEVPRKKAKEKEEETKKPVKAKKETGKTMNKEEIVAMIKGMTVLELADLVKALEEEFGVSAAPVAVAAPMSVAPAAEQTAEASSEEQVEFTVTLKEIGESKINVIKAVREVTSLGLKQAKDLVEAAPQVVKENVSKEEATIAKDKLQAAGAVVEIK
jgi:large subunit ribosomal protein L7/L12